MPWPPTLPAGARSNTTPQLGTHPDDHTKTNQSLADLVARADTWLTRLLVWSGIDNPASGITTAHTAVTVAATIPAGNMVVEARGAFGLGWGAGFAADDLATVDLMIDGAWSGMTSVVTPSVGAGTGTLQTHVVFMHIPSPGAHTYAWRVSRLSGAGTITLGSIGFGAIFLHAPLTPT